MVASGRQHRRHRSRAEADQLVIEYEASGVTQAEFCRQKELPLKTLARYLTRYRKQTARGNQPQQSQRLVAVEVAGAGNSGSELAVVLHGGLRIEVKRGFDATTLRQLGQPIHAPALERSESELPLLVSESGPRTVIEQPQLF